MFTESRAAWRKDAWTMYWARPLWNVSKSSKCLQSGPEYPLRSLTQALCYGAWPQSLLVTQQQLWWDLQLGYQPQDWSLGLITRWSWCKAARGSGRRKGLMGCTGPGSSPSYTPHASRGDVKSEVFKWVFAEPVMRDLKQEGTPQSIIHKDLNRGGLSLFKGDPFAPIDPPASSESEIDLFSV